MRNPQVNNPPHGARGVHESAAKDQARLYDTPCEGVSVQVLRIAPVHNRGNLRAYADAQLATPLGVFIFRRCRVIQQEGYRAYVSLPQEEWTGRDGKRGYTTLVTLPTPLAEVLFEAILSAWQEVEHG